MTLIIDYPLDENFVGVNTLQAQGAVVTGAASPLGIGDSLYIQDGVMVSSIYQDDEPTATGIRAEITAPADTLAERWYTWEFFVPETFSPVSSPIMLMQIHDTPDGGDPARALPFSLIYNQPGYLAAYVPLATLPDEGENSEMIALAPLEKGVWYSACFHALWSTTSTGFREFFLNRVPLFREYNVPTMYDDVVGPYFKCGCYDSTHGGGFGSATAYYRNVKIWSGNDGYETVMGGDPVLPPPVLQI